MTLCLHSYFTYILYVQDQSPIEGHSLTKFLPFLCLSLPYSQQKKLGIFSLPILEKCLSVIPSFVPALADRALAYYMADDIPNMMVSLEALEGIEPTHPAIIGLKKAAK
jgi:hypothetical protein